MPIKFRKKKTEHSRKKSPRTGQNKADLIANAERSSVGNVNAKIDFFPKRKEAKKRPKKGYHYKWCVCDRPRYHITMKKKECKCGVRIHHQHCAGCLGLLSTG